MRTRFKKLHLSAGISQPLNTALATFSRLSSLNILSNVSIASFMRSEEAIIAPPFLPVAFRASLLHIVLPVPESPVHQNRHSRPACLRMLRSRSAQHKGEI